MEENGKEEYVDFSDSEREPASSVASKLSRFASSIFWNISVIVLISIIAFSLGRFIQLERSRPPVKIISNSNITSTSTTLNSIQPAKSTDNLASPVSSIVNSPTNSGGQVVGSKNGSKYHYPWCSGAKQIAPQNLVKFNSIEDARKAGYTPAANCKGLK